MEDAYEDKLQEFFYFLLVVGRINFKEIIGVANPCGICVSKLTHDKYGKWIRCVLFSRAVCIKPYVDHGIPPNGVPQNIHHVSLSRFVSVGM